MKHLKTYENYNNEQIFHCYIPYTNEKMFIIALSKISIDENLKNDIINYIVDDEYFDNYRYYGLFLRFNLPVWDFYSVKRDENITKISKLLKDATYNTDGMKSTLAEGKSKYIGEIHVSEDDIELYDNQNKYNL